MLSIPDEFTNSTEKYSDSDSDQLHSWVCIFGTSSDTFVPACVTISCTHRIDIKYINDGNTNIWIAYFCICRYHRQKKIIGYFCCLQFCLSIYNCIVSIIGRICDCSIFCGIVSKFLELNRTSFFGRKFEGSREGKGIWQKNRPFHGIGKLSRNRNTTVCCSIAQILCWWCLHHLGDMRCIFCFYTYCVDFVSQRRFYHSQVPIFQTNVECKYWCSQKSIWQCGTQ